MRTVLFAPGNHPRRVAKAGASTADAVVLDLEDAVPAAVKVATRATVATAVLEQAGRAGAPRRLVRVNHLDTGLCAEDVAEVVGGAGDALDGLLFPKLESTAELAEVCRVLELAEQQAGLVPGSVALIPLIESPLGLLRLADLVTDLPARVVALGFGLGDYSMAMGLDPAEGLDWAAGLATPQALVAIAARAGGVLPWDGPWLDIGDLSGLSTDSTTSRRLGFTARLLIHPDHLTPAALAYARLDPLRLAAQQRIVAAYEAATSTGSAAITVDGRLVDEPVYRQARRLLAEADAAPRRGPVSPPPTHPAPGGPQ